MRGRIASCADVFDLGPVNIDAADLISRRAEERGRWQANITQAEHADFFFHCNIRAEAMGKLRLKDVNQCLTAYYSDHLEQKGERIPQPFMVESYRKTTSSTASQTSDTAIVSIAAR